MKKQLQGIALILMGIQMTLVWLAYPYVISNDVGPLLNVLPAFAVSAAGLFLCVRAKDGG